MGSSINPVNLWPAPWPGAPNCSRSWSKTQGKDSGAQITPWRPRQKEEPLVGKRRGQGRAVYPRDCTSGQAERVAQGQRQTRAVQMEPRALGPQRGHWGIPARRTLPGPRPLLSVNEGMDRGAAIFNTVHLSDSSLCGGRARWQNSNASKEAHSVHFRLWTPQVSAFQELHCKTRTHANFPPASSPSPSTPSTVILQPPRVGHPRARDTP